MEKMKRYLKTMPVLLVAFMLLAVTGYAAFLTNYGQITGEVEVTEAITLSLNGGDVTGYTVTGVAGSTYAQGIYEITNNAEVPVTMEIVTTYPEGDACDGITTTEHSNVGVLELTTKVVEFGTSPWEENDIAKATISYTIIGDTFSWDYVSSEGLDRELYTLVYHKDKSDRWNSPEATIPVTDVIGSLPYATDANIEEYSYCIDGTEGEEYLNCHGAKLWLVPTSSVALIGTNAFWGQADQFLFETDLIHYNNADVTTQVSISSGTLGTDLGEVTVMPGETMDFIIQNEIDLYFVESVGSLCTMTTTLALVE